VYQAAARTGSCPWRIPGGGGHYSEAPSERMRPEGASRIWGPFRFALLALEVCSEVGKDERQEETEGGREGVEGSSVLEGFGHEGVGE
jgi:hypothetical protein